MIQFPPPPVLAGDHSSDNTLASTGSRGHSPSTRLLSQQLGYGGGGSSTGGSHKSHGSPLLGPRPPRSRSNMRTPLGGQGLVGGGGGDYEVQMMGLSSAHRRADSDSPRYRTVGSEHSGHGVVNTNLPEEASDVEWYSQPLLNGRTSPQSSTLGDAESEDESRCSSRESCCSADHPLSHITDVNWADVLPGPDDNWGRGGSFSTDGTSTFLPPSSHARPPRPHHYPREQQHKSRPPQYRHHPHLDPQASVTSPLV